MPLSPEGGVLGALGALEVGLPSGHAVVLGRLSDGERGFGAHFPDMVVVSRGAAERIHREVFEIIVRIRRVPYY